MSEKGKVISENDYDLLLADKNWLRPIGDTKISIVDPGNKITPVMDYAGIRYSKAASFADALKLRPDLLVLTGVDSVNTSLAAAAEIESFVASGGKLLLLNSGILSSMIFPEQIRGIIKERGEITSMEIPESPVFRGIDPMDLRYFNNNKRENPTVISAAYRINRNTGIEALAAFTKVHGYLEGTIYERTKSLDTIRGFPIVKINNKGTAILSEMLLDKGATDPIAAKLLINMIEDLSTTLQ